MSTLHDGVDIEQNEKRKPSTVIDYNKTKFGVDVVDQMARTYTCKVAGRRWPVQVGNAYAHVYADYLVTAILCHIYKSICFLSVL